MSYSDGFSYITNYIVLSLGTRYVNLPSHDHIPEMNLNMMPKLPIKTYCKTWQTVAHCYLHGLCDRNRPPRRWILYMTNMTFGLELFFRLGTITFSLTNAVT